MGAAIFGPAPHPGSLSNHRSIKPCPLELFNCLKRWAFEQE
jgi:hypothetical protein